jgi:hypothetical protein
VRGEGLGVRSEELESRRQDGKFKTQNSEERRPLALTLALREREG